MIQFANLLSVGQTDMPRAAGFPLATTSDFALALAQISAPAGDGIAVAWPPGAALPVAADMAIGRQIPAATGNPLPVAAATGTDPVPVDDIALPVELIAASVPDRIVATTPASPPTPLPVPVAVVPAAPAIAAAVVPAAVAPRATLPVRQPLVVDAAPVPVPPAPIEAPPADPVMTVEDDAAAAIEDRPRMKRRAPGVEPQLAVAVPAVADPVVIAIAPPLAPRATAPTPAAPLPAAPPVIAPAEHRANVPGMAGSAVADVVSPAAIDTPPPVVVADPPMVDPAAPPPRAAPAPAPSASSEAPHPAALPADPRPAVPLAMPATATVSAMAASPAPPNEAPRAAAAVATPAAVSAEPARATHVVPQPAIAPAAPLPAAQAFAAVLAEPDATRARDRDDGHVDTRSAIGALAGLTVPAATQHAAEVPAPRSTGDAPLDLTRHDWMNAMIDKIETLQGDDGARETRIRLTPDALGTVDLSIAQDADGALQLRIVADTPQARAILADAAPRLAEMVEARGLKLGQSAVEGGAGQHDQPRHDARRPDAPASTRPAPVSTAVADDAETDTRIA